MRNRALFIPALVAALAISATACRGRGDNSGATTVASTTTTSVAAGKPTTNTSSTTAAVTTTKPPATSTLAAATSSTSTTSVAPATAAPPPPAQPEFVLDACVSPHVLKVWSGSTTSFRTEIGDLLAFRLEATDSEQPLVIQLPKELTEITVKVDGVVYVNPDGDAFKAMPVKCIKKASTARPTRPVTQTPGTAAPSDGGGEAPRPTDAPPASATPISTVTLPPTTAAPRGVPPTPAPPRDTSTTPATTTPGAPDPGSA